MQRISHRLGSRPANLKPLLGREAHGVALNVVEYRIELQPLLGDVAALIDVQIE